MVIAFIITFLIEVLQSATILITIRYLAEHRDNATYTLPGILDLEQPCFGLSYFLESLSDITDILIILVQSSMIYILRIGLSAVLYTPAFRSGESSAPMIVGIAANMLKSQAITGLIVLAIMALVYNTYGAKVRWNSKQSQVYKPNTVKFNENTPMKDWQILEGSIKSELAKPIKLELANGTTMWQTGAGYLKLEEPAKK